MKHFILSLLGENGNKWKLAHFPMTVIIHSWTLFPETQPPFLWDVLTSLPVSATEPAQARAPCRWAAGRPTLSATCRGQNPQGAGDGTSRQVKQVWPPG